MNKQIAQIYGACNPDYAAKRKFYYDCSKARGGGLFIKRIKEEISLANVGMFGDETAKDYKCFLFTGHSGCGKSSELKRLSRELEVYSDEEERFFPFFIDVDEYLDRFDVSITDILLAIITEISEILKANEEIKLSRQYFSIVTEKVKTSWELEKVEAGLPFGLGKMAIKTLKTDTSARQKIREALKNDTYLLLVEINKVLKEVRGIVKSLTAHGGLRNYGDIVIILDNLEKIQRFDGLETSLESAKRLFLDYSPQLTGIESHIIYTVPIDLMRSSDATRLRYFYDKDFVLPMVKIRKRDGETPYPTGIDSLKEILKLRLGDMTLEEAFEEDALQMLIDYSGGHIRSFIRFAREASVFAESLPINLSNAQSVIKNEIRAFSPSVPEKLWEDLAKLALSPTQEIENDTENYTEMLEKLFVFEYLNGDDEINKLSEEPWYAVNPIICELNKFKTAKEHLIKTT